MRINQIFFCVALASCTVLLTPVVIISQSFAAPAGRPNIVLFIGDDHSISDLGCYGNAVVRTPNLDRLAAQGLKFHRAFTPTAMCAPARSVLYTGLYPHRNGCHMNHGRIKPGTKTLPSYLKPLGYRVGLAGKTHIKPRQAFPFDYIAFQPTSPRELDFGAIEAFIDRAAGARPFCLIVASGEPHAPHIPGGYRPQDVPIPPYWVDTPETRVHQADYYGDIDRLDVEIGKMLDLLDKLNISDNTLTIYAADHGYSAYAKWSCYDAGIRVPFLVRWPGVIEAGSTTDAMISFVDILPTFIELAGGMPPQDIDGRSFAPLLRGRTQEHRDVILAAHTTNGVISGSVYPIRAVRTTRYKYIRNLNPTGTFENLITRGRKGKPAPEYWRSWQRVARQDAFAANRVEAFRRRPAEELYDLQDDPHELNNLATAPSHAAQRVELSSKLDAWMEQQGDSGLVAERAAKRLNE